MMRPIIEKQKKDFSFQIFLLKNNQDKIVEATEVDEKDIKEVKSRLEKGESVWMTGKREQKLNVNFIADESIKEPYYIHRNLKEEKIEWC